MENFHLVPNQKKWYLVYQHKAINKCCPNTKKNQNRYKGGKKDLSQVLYGLIPKDTLPSYSYHESGQKVYGGVSRWVGVVQHCAKFLIAHAHISESGEEGAY